MADPRSRGSGPTKDLRGELEYILIQHFRHMPAYLGVAHELERTTTKFFDLTHAEKLIRDGDFKTAFNYLLPFLTVVDVENPALKHISSRIKAEVLRFWILEAVAESRRQDALPALKLFQENVEDPDSYTILHDIVLGLKNVGDFIAFRDTWAGRNRPTRESVIVNFTNLLNQHPDLVRRCTLPDMQVKLGKNGEELTRLRQIVTHSINLMFPDMEDRKKTHRLAESNDSVLPESATKRQKTAEGASSVSPPSSIANTFRFPDSEIKAVEFHPQRPELVLVCLNARASQLGSLVVLDVSSNTVAAVLKRTRPFKMARFSSFGRYIGFSSMSGEVEVTSYDPVARKFAEAKQVVQQPLASSVSDFIFTRNINTLCIVVFFQDARMKVFDAQTASEVALPPLTTRSPIITATAFEKQMEQELYSVVTCTMVGPKGPCMQVFTSDSQNPLREADSLDFPRSVVQWYDNIIWTDQAAEDHVLLLGNTLTSLKFGADAEPKLTITPDVDVSDSRYAAKRKMSAFENLLAVPQNKEVAYFALGATHAPALLKTVDLSFSSEVVEKVAFSSSGKYLVVTSPSGVVRVLSSVGSSVKDTLALQTREIFFDSSDSTSRSIAPTLSSSGFASASSSNGTSSIVYSRTSSTKSKTLSFETIRNLPNTGEFVQLVLFRKDNKSELGAYGLTKQGSIKRYMLSLPDFEVVNYTPGLPPPDPSQKYLQFLMTSNGVYLVPMTTSSLHLYKMLPTPFQLVTEKDSDKPKQHYSAPTPNSLNAFCFLPLDNNCIVTGLVDGTVRVNMKKMEPMVLNCCSQGSVPKSPVVSVKAVDFLKDPTKTLTATSQTAFVVFALCDDASVNIWNLIYKGGPGIGGTTVLPPISAHPQLRYQMKRAGAMGIAVKDTQLIFWSGNTLNSLGVEKSAVKEWVAPARITTACVYSDSKVVGCLENGDMFLISRNLDMVTLGAPATFNKDYGVSMDIWEDQSIFVCLSKGNSVILKLTE